MSRRLRIAPAIAVFLLFAGCRSTSLLEVFPVRFDKVNQIVLATKSDNVSFEQRVKKNILPPLLVSEALIRVDSHITVDYYVDLKADGGHLRYSSALKEMRFSGGPIRAKKPVIDRAKVFIVEKGIWVNEEKEARLILETLTDRFATYGENWLRDETLRTNCESSLREFISRFGKDSGLDVARINLHLRR